MEATISTRATALAGDLERLVAEAVSAVERVDPRDGAAVSRDEGWPVYFAARHIAESLPLIMGVIGVVAAGEQPPQVTQEMLDGINAEALAAHGGINRDVAVSLLRERGASTAAAIRSLSDEQLARSAVIALFGPEPRSVDWLLEYVLLGHSRHHLDSLRAAR